MIIGPLLCLVSALAFYIGAWWTESMSALSWEDRFAAMQALLSSSATRLNSFPKNTASSLAVLAFVTAPLGGIVFYRQCPAIMSFDSNSLFAENFHSMYVFLITCSCRFFTIILYQCAALEVVLG
jgi:hypothetical protein